MTKEGKAYFSMNTFTFEQLEFYSKYFKANHILSALLQLLSCFHCLVLCFLARNEAKADP